SLWADEATLALNIINRPLVDLFKPLAYEQGAPLGFLTIEKLIVEVVGDHEYTLRLFPFICGITSLFLFYQLAKRIIEPGAIAIAVALFVSLEPLIYYTTEVKQYSSDVTIALLLYLVLMNIRQPKLKPRQMIGVSLLGAIAVWFSHPAIFVLVGIEASYWFSCWLNRERIHSWHRLWIYAVWLASFFGIYLISLAKLGRDKELLKSWSQAFPRSLFDLSWLLTAIAQMFANPLGFLPPLILLAIFACLLGCFTLGQQNRDHLILLLVPIGITLAAAYLKKYPFHDRLLLFLVPNLILLIAIGIHTLFKHQIRLRQLPQLRLSKLLGVILTVLLLTPSLGQATQLVFQPEQRQEIRPVLKYIKKHQQAGDILYIYQRGIHQFKYYADKYGFNRKDYILGVDDLDVHDGKKLSKKERERYKADLDRLRGNPRVWLLFSHARVRAENQMIRNYLDQIGDRLDTYRQPGVFVYLYDLSRKK
ncbi:MAG TPA: glycosyltransferase family 39 protein, partial [Microcoleaceae cyanobacterium]